MTVEENPLIGPAPKEIFLPDAPLVRVIAQVRFSSILAVQNSEHIAPFQEAIRSVYPVLEQEHVPSLLVSPDGVAAGQEAVAWRFSSLDCAWRASLTQEFIALEATAYENRSGFMERMEFLLAAVKEHLDPTVVQRVGLRYIAQVVGEPLNNITDMITPALLGIAVTPLFEDVRNLLSEAQMEAREENGELRLRWGQLEAGAMYDPNAVVPIKQRSWILDYDMSRSKQVSFEVDVLVDDLNRFANRLYKVFRWSVTDRFLECYGGKL